jgi:hypothetical protein
MSHAEGCYRQLHHRSHNCLPCRLHRLKQDAGAKQCVMKCCMSQMICRQSLRGLGLSRQLLAIWDEAQGGCIHAVALACMPGSMLEAAGCNAATCMQQKPLGDTEAVQAGCAPVGRGPSLNTCLQGMRPCVNMSSGSCSNTPQDR